MRRLTLIPATALAAAFALAPFAANAQDGDPAAGQRVFNQCRACHTINEGGRNGVGPNLHGVVGRAAGTVEGFRYSAAMQEWREGKSWTEENLRAYLADPKALIPRGSMSFAGLRNPQQLNDVIAYLKAN